MEKDLVLVLCQLFVSLTIFSDVHVTGEVTIDPPTDIRPDGDLVVDAGSNFALTCRGDLAVTWAYNDYINENESQKAIITYNEQGKEIATLTVEQAYYLDTGYFTCYPVMEGPSSPQAQKIYVYVRGTSIIQSSHTNTLPFTPATSPDPVREDQLFRIDQCKSRLTLTNVSMENAGEYTCVATDSSGKHSSQSVTLTVLRPGQK